MIKQQNQQTVKVPEWNAVAVNGYEPKTTFWQDFSIAELFGMPAVQDTFDRVKKEWADDYVYWTELVLVLNHKIWEFYEISKPLARLYDKLWREAEDIAFSKMDDGSWPKEAADYYYRVTD